MNFDVERVISTVPKDRKLLFDRLHALIMDLYPNAEIGISYRIPTYRAKSGWVALSCGNSGVSLFTNGPHHLAEFKAKNPNIKTGRASITLEVSDVLPVTALTKVIRHAIEHPRNPDED
ncbi:MAG: DUF1801 domain-containing protein [Candidatus Eiseniibacteriota bacterium]